MITSSNLRVIAALGDFCDFRNRATLLLSRALGNFIARCFPGVRGFPDRVQRRFSGVGRVSEIVASPAPMV